MLRYWHKRYELWKIDWTIRDATESYPPFDVFDAKHDRMDWKLADDRVLGGFSRADWKQTDRYVRWMGKLDTTVGLQSKVHRSGFCAIYHDNFVDLQGNYEHLEIVCRAVPSTRAFTVNVSVESSIPEDLYQGELRFQNGNNSMKPHVDSIEDLCNALDDLEFESFVLPFRSLTVTSRGRTRHVRRVLDDRIVLERLGFILKDKVDGNFVMDIAQIRAVNLNETGIVGDKTPYLNDRESGPNQTQAE